MELWSPLHLCYCAKTMSQILGRCPRGRSTWLYLGLCTQITYTLQLLKRCTQTRHAWSSSLEVIAFVLSIQVVTARGLSLAVHFRVESSTGGCLLLINGASARFTTYWIMIEWWRQHWTQNWVCVRSQACPLLLISSCLHQSSPGSVTTCQPLSSAQRPGAGQHRQLAEFAQPLRI